MQRTYYIRYTTFQDGVGYVTKYDKVIHRSPDDRARWHKAEALYKWQLSHRGYARKTIRDVFTVKEYNELTSGKETN